MKNAGIPHAVPYDYYDISEYEKTDAAALKIASSWYSVLGSDLHHRGIPLGQMMENELYYIFVDVLRSKKIAEQIMLREDPEITYGPLEISFQEPGTICYEFLPGFLRTFSSIKGKKYFIIKSPVLPVFHEEIEIFFTGFRTFWRNSIYRAYQAYCILKLKRSERKPVIFLNVYVRLNIQKCLENVESIPLSPYPVFNGTARKSIRRIKKLFNEGIEHNPTFMADYFDNLPVLPVLEKRFKKLFVHDMPKVIRNIEWANDTVNRIQPSAIVLMEDVSPVKRAICRAFKNRNIPAIVIQHGILSEDMSGFHVMPKEADVQAVWGDASRRWQIERGAQPHTQIVTGNPRFDDITRTSSYDSQEIINRLSLDPDKKKILIATEYFSGISSRWTTEAEERLIRQSLCALKKIPQAQVIVKLHPSYQKKYGHIVSTIALEEKIDAKIVKEGLWELIHVSDVIVIQTSTVGLEAILLKKPLIVTNFDNRTDAGYKSSGAAVIVNSQDALYRAVNELLYGEQDKDADAEAKEKYILDNAYYQDGKASRRVANLITLLIKK